MIQYSRRDSWPEAEGNHYRTRRWRFGHVELIRKRDGASVYFQDEADLAQWDTDMAKLDAACPDDPHRWRFLFDQIASAYDDVMEPESSN